MRSSPLALRGTALCCALAAVATPPRALAQAPDAPVRVDGEYGLYVTRSADTLVVAWLTRTRGVGWAQLVGADGRAGRRRTTRAGVEHTARFVHPADDTVVVRYGARDDAGDRHETRLRLTRDPPRPPVSYTGVDSIYVMGDIHGELSTVRAVLRNAGVIDGRGRWSAGRAHLAVVGDMVDRGDDATAVLWLLYGLEPQALAAGGRLDVVLGNHELMVLLDDLRYVQPKELSIAQAHGVRYDRMFDPRRSILGTWLASKPVVVRVNDVLLAHGGVSSDYLGYSLEALDDTLAAFTHEELFYRWADSTYVVALDSAGLERRNDLFWGDRSPVWYRAYVGSDSVGAELDAVLDHFGARVHVVGHTPLPTIRQRYGGALIAVNTYPFAAELLLLVRDGDGYERWRIRAAGPPERVEPARPPPGPTAPRPGG